jgi:hypothetical protein
VTELERAYALLLADLLTTASEQILALIDDGAATETAVERIIGGTTLLLGGAIARNKGSPAMMTS